jgi:hypothetical protein
MANARFDCWSTVARWMRSRGYVVIVGDPITDMLDEI